MEIHIVGRATYEVDTISFEEDDFLLDSNEHNRLLYLEGILNRKSVKRILVDLGSAVIFCFPSCYIVVLLRISSNHQQSFLE